MTLKGLDSVERWGENQKGVITEEQKERSWRHQVQTTLWRSCVVKENKELKCLAERGCKR